MKTLALLLMPLALVGCMESNSESKTEGGWVRIGQVSDGNYGATIWKIQDKDTGDTIYATSKGGVFVVKANK